MKVLVAGDFCPRNRVVEAIQNKNYNVVFDEIRALTEETDYSIVNFECPVVNKKALPIKKEGPNLCCTSEGIDAIKYAGFKCVSLANNHFLDFGDEGVAGTLATLDAFCIDHVGGGRNIREASRILYKDIAGQRLAIINCCEHEFSIATDTSAGSNPLNPIQQYYAIQEAQHNADRVLVIIHGGHEHFQLPSPRMVETYRFFIDAGADAVVNHHQHCYSGYEFYKEKPIFYGLGNFCFDNPKTHSGIWTEGFAVIIDFSDTKPTFSLHPYRQCADKPKVEFLSKDAFDNKIKKLNEIIANEEALKAAVDRYYASCANQYSSIFEPIRNKYYLAAKKRNWVPSLITQKRKLVAANFILCEAHRDKLSWWLNH